MRTRRVTEDQSMRRNIARDNRPRANQRKLANCHTTPDHRTTPQRCAILHKRRGYFPVVTGLEVAVWCNRTGKQVISEADMGANENAIFYGDTRKD